MLVWIAGAVIAVVATVGWLQHRAQRGIHTPLAQRRPATPTRQGKAPLGMEATDLGLISRVTRRNETLERGHTSWTRLRGGPATAAPEHDIAALPDDETYARRYFAAFIKDKTKDTADD